MPKKPSSHLKIHVEELAHQVGETGDRTHTIDLADLMDVFTRATGWTPRPITSTSRNKNVLALHEHAHELAEQPVPPLRRRVRLVCSDPMDGMLESDQLAGVTSEEEAWALLEQIDRLLQELKAAEGIIERQEAQLATSVGVSIRKDEAELLTSRLRESLQRAAEQTGSDAAAIYLLDDTTSELKMRCCWGLTTASLAAKPRQLRGALADLEALMGNAVLVENTKLAPEWNCPENFAAAFCLPIGSPTMPQGTLWLWSEHVRDFCSSDIEIARAAADKILVDIERSVLADEVLKTRARNRQLDSAGMIQSSRLPTTQPLHSDYEIGGWTFQGQSLGGNFHTWTVNKNEQICAAMGAAMSCGPSGALVATSVQTVVETCWQARHRPSQVLRKANDILWDVQDGDWRSSLCYLQIHPDSGSTQLSLAGDIQVFIVNSHGARVVGGTPTRLAEQPDTSFTNEQLYLDGGDLLLIASANVVAGATRGGITQDALLKTVSNMHEDAVEDIADHLARLLPMDPLEPGPDDLRRPSDRSLMIIRRKF